MKKQMLIGFVIFLVFLIGCSNEKYSIEVTHYVYKSVNEPSLRREVVRTFTIEDSKEVKMFLGALAKAEKTNKLYDIEPPMFIVKVIRGDKLIDVYELWLMNKENAKGIMRIQGEQAWYDLNVDVSGKLIELLYK